MGNPFLLNARRAWWPSGTNIVSSRVASRETRDICLLPLAPMFASSGAHVFVLWRPLAADYSFAERYAKRHATQGAVTCWMRWNFSIYFGRRKAASRSKRRNGLPTGAHKLPSPYRILPMDAHGLWVIFVGRYPLKELFLPITHGHPRAGYSEA